MAKLIGTTTTASIDNGPDVPADLTITQDQIDVTSALATKPDPEWTYVDQRGHFHAYDEDGKLPTLRTRIERTPCPGGCDDPGCDGYTVTHHHCVICGEEVEPRRVHDFEPKTVPGLTHWTLVVDQGIPQGQQVSVRVRSGAPADPIEVFGVAMVVGVEAMMVGDQWRTQSTLDGVGPLGKRRLAGQRR